MIYSKSWSLNLGIGPKLPTGKTTATNSQGLLLVNDMQPGTGALDMIFRMAMSYQLPFRPSMTYYFQSIWSKKGTDNDYLGSQSYTFGNVIQLISGWSDQLIWKNRDLYPSISVRYRQTDRDRIDNNELENTGGQWLFLRMGIGSNILKNDRISMSIEVPVITHVDGTQLSPDRIINITYYHSLDLNPTPIQQIKL